MRIDAYIQRYHLAAPQACLQHQLGSCRLPRPQPNVSLLGSKPPFNLKGTMQHGEDRFILTIREQLYPGGNVFLFKRQPLRSITRLGNVRIVRDNDNGLTRLIQIPKHV